MNLKNLMLDQKQTTPSPNHHQRALIANRSAHSQFGKSQIDAGPYSLTAQDRSVVPSTQEDVAANSPVSLSASLC
jgi:hypothetical protein